MRARLIKGRPARRRRIAALAAVALLATALGVALFATRALDSQELATVNARFSVRGRQPAPRNIVVVGIDDVTFGDLNLRWPFPRDIHARVIDRLRRDGARAIAYDVQFTEPSPNPPAYCPYVDADAPPPDCALVTATGNAGNLIFSTTEVSADGHTNVLGGDDVLKALGARAGNGIFPADSDGTTRHLRYSDSGLTSFAAAAVERATGRRLPARRSAWIDFRGPPGTITEIPLSRVLRGDFKPGYFRNKIVVVGAVAPTLKDLFHTPVGGGEVMSGPELQASAIDTILRGDPLRDAAPWIDYALIALLGLAIPLISIRLRAARALAVGLALGIAFAVGNQLAFDSGVVVTVLYPLIALFVAAIGALVVHYLTETRERRRTRLVFARFVPEDVVDEVLARADDDLRIGGVELDGTVMFCDLRGFTTFAESLPVDQVIDVLNHYLEQMSSAILEHRGTLVSYMGDGIMAVFGAPIEQDDHADRALAAAREMLGPRLERFNRYIRERGLGDGFRMGIGINSGKVMSGNVGSKQRLEYAAIGDTTNTAARIEQMTKGTPHQLLLGESTWRRLGERQGDLMFFSETEVRGRREAIRLWALVEEPTLTPPVVRETSSSSLSADEAL